MAGAARTGALSRYWLELPKLQLHRDHDLVAYRKKLIPPAENRALRACLEFSGRRAGDRVGKRRRDPATP
jgi:hypothetical protein